MLERAAYVVVITSILAVSGRAQASTHPPTIILDGTSSLPLAGEAARVHLLGLVEIYSLAIYVEGSVRDRTLLASPEVPKILRIEIQYADDLRRQLQIDWRRELVPELTPAGTAHLQRAFAALRHGDVISVEYVPGKGTDVRVNKVVAVLAASHDLMMAFLDHWLGQRPVSEEIKRTLTESSGGP